jgi:hypothetical protein
MKLYEITEVMREILMTLAEPEPAPDDPDYAILMAEREAAQDALGQTEMDLRDKLRAYVAVAQELKVEREARELEIARIESTVLERMRTANAQAARKEQWLMESAAAVIRQFDVALPIKYLEFTLGKRKSPPSCQVLDPSLIPDEYLRIVPEVREPDRKKLLTDLKEGVIIPGAKLADVTYTLTVR